MRTKEEKQLRELLAIQHRHQNIEGYSYMYYDDGELQCGACGCDFLRDTAEVLNKKIRTYNIKLYESCTGLIK